MRVLFPKLERGLASGSQSWWREKAEKEKVAAVIRDVLQTGCIDLHGN